MSGAPARAVDSDGLDLICPLVEYERGQAVQDSRTELELVENEHHARKRVFEMIEKLWKARSIEQEIYLDYKRLRDRTKARLGRLAIQIEQQRTARKQYELACDRARGDATEDARDRIAELQSKYRRLDCELLASDSEIAGIDYAFDKAALEATIALAERNIKSRYELVIDEYDLSQSKARLESYRDRAAACKAQLSD